MWIEFLSLWIQLGVYIRCNGIVEWTSRMVEWNSGMDYWNGGILYRTYLIIQQVLYNEQQALRCVLCMHCWLDGWVAIDCTALYEL